MDASVYREAFKIAPRPHRFAAFRRCGTQTRARSRFDETAMPAGHCSRARSACINRAFNLFNGILTWTSLFGRESRHYHSARMSPSAESGERACAACASEFTDQSANLLFEGAEGASSREANSSARVKHRKKETRRRSRPRPAWISAQRLGAELSTLRLERARAVESPRRTTETTEFETLFASASRFARPCATVSGHARTCCTARLEMVGQADRLGARSGPRLLNGTRSHGGKG